MAQLPPVRPEYQRETALPGALPLDTPLPLTTRHGYAKRCWSLRSLPSGKAWRVFRITI